MPSCSSRAFRARSRFIGKVQLKEAETLYNDVLKRERNQFDALHLLGLLRYQQTRYSDAQLLIATALKANSGSVAALTNHGLALDKLGRREEALASYDKALALAPANVDLFFNRGNVLLALGRHEH